MKLLAALCLLPYVASAVPITGASLAFDGLGNGEQVLGYYSGGLAGSGSGPGPNFGVSFTNGLAAEPTVIAFGASAVVTAPSVTMNLNAPWVGVLSFYFTGGGSVAFYSGPDATGSLLQRSTLVYPPFFPFSAQPGSVRSAVFLPGTGATLRLDSITFGANVIPEPSVVGLAAVGTGLLFALKRLTRRAANHQS
jgi:hypothetical protein